MESPRKKLKITFDPLERFEDNLELLLQHLTAHELLACTQVSPSWNDCIGSSSQLQGKVKLKINETNNVTSLASRRRYETLKFDTIFTGEDDAMLTVLERNADNLTHLDLQECSIRWKISTAHSINLAHLKHLTAYRLSCDLMRNVVHICGDKLTVISVTGTTLDDNFNKLLLGSHALKELTILKCRLSNKHFDTNCRFQLATFEWDNLGFYDADLLESFVGRLVHHNISSLESITLNKANSSLVAIIISTFKALRKLKLNYLYSDGLELQSITKNSKLEKLQVMNAPLRERQNILEACDNLKRLQVDQLTKELVDYVQTNLPHLEKLQYISPYKRKRFHCYKYEFDFNDFNLDQHVSLDPLIRLPKSCCNLIFQHVTGKEALNYSSSSILWFNYIADSPHCMSHVKINVKASSGFFHEVFIANSTRHYQDVRIYSLSRTCAVTELSCVLNKTFESLTRLDVGCYCGATKKLDLKFKLLKLRHLSFMTYAVSPLLVKCILNNAVESLECLELSEQSSDAISEVVADLRARKLILRNISANDSRIWRKFTNWHILEMDLTSSNVDSDETKSLLLSCPSLQTIHIDYLSSELMNFMSMNTPQVKRILYRRIEAKCNDSEAFEAIKYEPTATIDPLIRIPETLHNLMFQHLNSRFDAAITTISNVSKCWFNFTASSSVFMNKLMLRVKLDDKTDGAYLAAIGNARRNYSKIVIALKFQSTEMCFKAPASSFKALVEVDSMCLLQDFLAIPFDNENVNFYALNLLNRFCNYFKELAIESVELFPPASNTFVIPRTFSHLEKLAIKSHKAIDLNFLFSQFKFKQVREVFLENFYLSATRVDDFVAFLEHNEAITDLFLNNCRGIEGAFRCDASARVKFRLRQLYLPIYEQVGLDGNSIDDNLNRFLVTQMRSIVWLHLVHVSGSQIDTILTNCCNLREFGFLKITGYSRIQFHRIRPIDSLKILKLPFMYNIEFIRPFLKCAPYLTVLSVCGISDEILEHLVMHMRCLKKLNFEHSRVEKRKLTSHDVGESFEYKGIRLEKWHNMMAGSGERIYRWIHGPSRCCNLK